MEFLPPLSPFSVFLAIAAVGFLFLIVSLLFGEASDLFHVDTDGDHGGPGFFSGRVIGVFITAFGGFGAIGIHYGLPAAAASALGLVSGVVFGAVIYSFAKFLYCQEASSEVRSGDLVGLSARVIVAIPSNGVGQVRCRVGEELIDKVAQAAGGVAIAENATVRIDEVLGAAVVVKTL